MTDAIIVFARAPRAGRVKTRLAAEVGDIRAAALYEKLLRHAITIAEQSLAGKRFLYAASDEDCNYFTEYLAADVWQIMPQTDGDLGARMASAITNTLTEADSAVLIGSDIVDSQIGDLDCAFSQLAGGKDVVIGPVADGGYWLIGCKQPIDCAFVEVDWSTGKVFAQTERRLNANHLTYAALTQRHDIDSSDDLALMSVGWEGNDGAG